MNSLQSIFIGAVLGSVSASALANQLPPRIIVKFKESKQSTNLNLKHEPLQKLANGAFILPLAQDKTKLLTANSAREQLKQKLAELNQREDVLYAIEDRVGYFEPEPALQKQITELNHSIQWDEFSAPQGVQLESGPDKIDGAWQRSQGEASPPVVVAVLDTGIEENHRLLANLVTDENGKTFGWNFAGNNAYLADETGGYHGTHVAGTIASSGQDMVGMGPKLKILPIKIPDSTGMFYESAVINGIYWALGYDVPGVPNNPYPAKVMNMSFGIDEGPGKEVENCDAAVQEAVDAANEAGAVITVASGNRNSENDLGSPGGCNGVVRVNSTGPTGLRAYYSNYGDKTDYAAPGGDKHYGEAGGILSTVKPGEGINGSGLDFKQGTSMATPHVAGLFGLVFAYGQSQDITGEQAKTIVNATTHDFGSSDNPDDSCVGKKSCGHGIVDAKQALDAVAKGFNTYITSPDINTLKLTSNACPADHVTAQAKQIKSKTGIWILTKNACVKQNKLQQLILDKNKLVANYSGIKYQLSGSFENCELIGIDGVGCHK